MLFNSYVFVLLFLPIVLALYYLSNRYQLYRVSLLILLVASFVFYAYNNIKYVFILLISILVNWSISKLMLRCKQAKIWLVVGIGLNVACIFVFKYYDFFIKNVNQWAETQFNYLNLILPLGISFYTFQQISYLVDSYRGETKDYTFLEYATFVSFFPQLVAGPIVLHEEVISQFKDTTKKAFNHESFAAGIYVFSVGLFKKVLIADTLGNAVGYAWNQLDYLTTAEILLIMLSYTFQIYFDFSGYCDMAIGIGKMFRIDLPVNFCSPYKATSIIDFWKRWHITLTRFLRRYVYFPLGGSRKSKLETCRNILLVFVISGIWHGANWTFVLWGILHGIANVLNRVFEKYWNKLWLGIRWLGTFVFVNFTWLLFRADSVHQAANLLKRILKFESLEVNMELAECYMLKEAIWLDEMTGLSNILPGFPKLCMGVLLIGCLIVCIGITNLHEETFVPTLKKALITPVLLIWSIVSFAGVSTFLCFNF